MIALTHEVLSAAMPFASPARVDRYLPFLAEALTTFGIDTPLRASHFLAQVAHESGSLRYVREIADGAAYDTGSLALRLGNTPEADGDGQRYKGRGLIQITGLANYRDCGVALELPLIETPELLEQPRPAALSAGWYWVSRGLNGIADTDDAVKITRIINGGTNGLQDRIANLRRAKAAFGLPVEG